MDRAWNDRLPRLDAIGSWSQLGLGKSWGGSTKEQLEGDFYEWQVGFAFEVPIFNSVPRAQYAQAEIAQRQSQKRLESVEQTIGRVRMRRPFDLVIRDINDDPEDYERYKELIPVVTVEGREVARYRLTEAELEAALQ